jgi:leucyl-tRNA synthetase
MPWDRSKGDYWLPVDQYTGGIEHATMHLLYTRFFTKALRDLGVVPFDEPMLRLFNQGMVLGPDGEKMSKSRGNVVNPDVMVDRYGADTVRGYLMFIGPWDQGGPWDPKSIEGVHRFLHRVWAIATDSGPEQVRNAATEEDAQALERKLHQAIIKVTEDMSAFRFNTAIAALMDLNNTLMKFKETSLSQTPLWRQATDTLVLMMAPIFPHMSEELWRSRGHLTSVHVQEWPVADPEKAREETVEIVVQVNGKIRERLSVALGTSAADLEHQGLQAASRWLDGKPARKVIVVPDKLVNIVI